MVSRITIKLIDVYKVAISPLLPSSCRFEPTCSMYMRDGIELHGALIGTIMGVRRILRCHPWSVGGFDPVPMKSRYSKK
ncbi:MAG: membrane protein insertion efficiency factor YidD [SAR202 cluster bacterium]|nr:membrane protein insertion efficiency factor YidD [SAR202 cluster bacterium]